MLIVARLGIPGLSTLFWYLSSFSAQHASCLYRILPRNSYPHPQSEAPGLFLVQFSAGNWPSLVIMKAVYQRASIPEKNPCPGLIDSPKNPLSAVSVVKESRFMR